MNEQKKKEIFVIKSTYGGKDTSGIICIISDVNSGELYFIDSVVASQKDAVLPDIKLSISDFQKELSLYKQKYLVNSQLTLPLQQTMLKLFTKEEIKRLYSISDKNLQNAEILATIRKALKETLKEDVKLNCEISVIDKNEYKPEKKDEKKTNFNKIENTEEMQELEKKKIEIYLKTQVAIDPAGGKTIFELCKRDNLLVKIVDERPEAEYINELLGGKHNKEIIPICAPVVKAEELGEDRYRLIVKFGPGIFGETIVLSSIKMKVIKEQEMQTKEDNFTEKTKINSFVITPLALWWGILILSFIVLIIFAKIIQ